MPILLKTQAERTAKTPIQARRARVGGLCGFRSPAERVPTGSLKIGRCAGVRECWRKMLILARTAVGKAACDKRGNTPKRAKSRDFARCGEKAARKRRESGEKAARKRRESGEKAARKRRESGEKAARKQDKAAGSCAPRGGHICPRCGQFRGFTRAFQKAQKSAMGCCRMKKARRFKEYSEVPTKDTR